MKNESELLQAIDYFSTNNSEQKRIADLSRERVLREHTYVHRMGTALKHVFYATFPSTSAHALPTMADLKTAAYGDDNMQAFLSQFRDHEPASLQKLFETVTKTQHKLSRAELIVLLMHEFRNWGVEKGVIQ